MFWHFSDLWNFWCGVANFGLSVGYERNFFNIRMKKDSTVIIFNTAFVITVFIILALLTYLFSRLFLSGFWFIGIFQYFILGILFYWDYEL